MGSRKVPSLVSKQRSKDDPMQGCSERMVGNIRHDYPSGEGAGFIEIVMSSVPNMTGLNGLHTYVPLPASICRW